LIRLTFFVCSTSICIQGVLLIVFRSFVPETDWVLNLLTFYYLFFNILSFQNILLTIIYVQLNITFKFIKINLLHA
jgi:hypothetical protein